MEATSIALAATSLAAFLAYWLAFCTRDLPGPTGAAVKTLSTGLLALLLWILVAGGLPALWPIALGLSLGAAGDWFLAQRGERAFLAGMAAFGAGHLAYAGGFLVRGAEIGFDGWSGAEVGAGAVLVLLLLSTPFWLLPRTGALRLPVAAYVLLIGLMAFAAMALPQRHGQDLLRLGAALFVLSDLLLSLRLFVVKGAARQRLLSLMLWPAYWAGQALIGWASLLYWLPEKG